MAKETLTDKRLQKAKRIGEPIAKRLFDLKSAAIYLGRPVYGVRALIWKGRLPVIQDGRKQYIDVKDIDSYIDGSKTTMI